MDTEADQTIYLADQTTVTSDQAPEKSVPPWTIKGVPPEVRYAAVEASKRQKQPQGEWVARAIRLLLQHDRQQTPRLLPVTIPVPADQQVRQSSFEADLAEVERLMEVVKDLHGVTSAAPPKRLTNLAYSLVSARLKTIKAAAQSDLTG